MCASGIEAGRLPYDCRLSSAALAPKATAMPDASFRLSAPSAALDRFDTLLRASGSATRILEAWMAEHHGGARGGLSAHVRALSAPRMDAAIMARLGVGQWDDISYRRVWLVSRGRVLSVAENWYVPVRLDPAMAAQLTDGTTPFGAVIASLTPTRETLSAERLWDGTERKTNLPTALLRHNALVRAGDGTPLCEVNEVYTRNILL